MKTKALLALNNFIHINKLQNYPLMKLLGMLENHFEIQKKLGYYMNSFKFEEFLCTLQGDIWTQENWEYWVNMYNFRGELDEYLKEMPLKEAIIKLVNEWDF